MRKVFSALVFLGCLHLVFLGPLHFASASQIKIASTNQITVKPCEDYLLSLNSVTIMKIFSNGVKVFGIDMEEPVGSSMGIAVTINRGNSQETRQQFCRFIPGFLKVDVENLKSTYNKTTQTLYLHIKVKQKGAHDEISQKSLQMQVNKQGRYQEELVSAIYNPLPLQ